MAYHQDAHRLGRPRRADQRNPPAARCVNNDLIIMEAVRAEMQEAQLLNETWPQNAQAQGNWRQSDPNVARFIAQEELASISSQFREYIGSGSKLTVSNIQLAVKSSTQVRDSRYKLQDKILNQGGSNEKISAEKQESIMKWFDRSVEKELKKRRDNAANVTSNTVLDPALAALQQRHAAVNLNVSKGTLQRMADASASRLEVATQLKQEQINELTEAVDNLAKAEAMCAFAGAVRAAEAAAENATPEMVEEAAAAGARGFQTESEDVIEETIPGEKPVEVIGYVGITRPKHPIKPKK